MIKITAENIRKSAEEKGFKIIAKRFGDIRNRIICRCPLNCLVSTKDEWYASDGLAEKLNVNQEWVVGFIAGFNGLDKSYVDKSDPVEVKGYISGKQIRKELKL